MKREATVNATKRLAEGVVEIAAGSATTTARHIAKRAIMDAVSNALLARRTPLGRRYRTIAATHVDQGGVPILGGEIASPTDAAFINAGLCNALDWDDTIEGAGHPGASILPAAIAVGVRENATVQQLLDAVIAGYEVSIRVARALEPTPERYDVVHGSGTRHAVGAAAATAAISGLDTCSVQEQLGFGAQLAPVPHAGSFGWKEGQLTWLKDNVARAASAGVRAWEIATAGADRVGFAGPRRVLDDNRGFWRMAGSDQCDWEMFTVPSNQHLLPQLSFKPYPCCRWLHCAIEAAEAATRKLGQVDALTVRTADCVAENFDIEPTDQVTAEFSLPFVIGQVLDERSPGEWYTSTGHRTVDADIGVQITEDKQFSEQFRENGIVGAGVLAKDTSGVVSEATVERPLGGSDRPLPATHFQNKLDLALSGSETEFDDSSAVRAALNTNMTIESFCNHLTDNNQSS